MNSIRKSRRRRRGRTGGRGGRRRFSIGGGENLHRYDGFTCSKKNKLRSVVFLHSYEKNIKIYQKTGR